MNSAFTIADSGNCGYNEDMHLDNSTSHTKIPLSEDERSIQVWSTQEGEQRFDNHTDKLLNYIRFWQADGESEKTSIRTRTSLGQLVEAGHFKGGFAAYGYDLVKSGRLNKKKHELLDLQINEEEAAVVRLIFDKYTIEGYGAQRIATYLNRHGYHARSGKNWHPASIRGILCNLTYTGVLRSGDSRSEILPELQIISPQQYETAQKIREERAKHAKENPTVPQNTRGQSLLSGNVLRSLRRKAESYHQWKVSPPAGWFYGQNASNSVCLLWQDQKADGV